MGQKYKRNTTGLIAHARRKHDDCMRRAEEAIRFLLREGHRVNFNVVSRTARVSAAWLYDQEKLKLWIMQLREEKPPPAVPRRQKASEDSKDKIISALRERLKKNEAEMKKMKEQLKVAYGQLTAERP